MFFPHFAHHGNSANNRFNPTLDAAVNWGEITNDEMTLPWFVVVDRDEQPDTIVMYKPGDLNSRVPIPQRPPP
jgi:hypothetical protein